MNRLKEQKAINYLNNELKKIENREPQNQLLILKTLYHHLDLQCYKIKYNEDFDAKDAVDYHYEKWAGQTNNRNSFIDLVFETRELLEKVQKKQKVKWNFFKKDDSQRIELQRIERELKTLLTNSLYKLGLKDKDLLTTLKDKTREDTRVHCTNTKLEDEGKLLLVSYKNRARWKLNDLDTIFGGQISLAYEYSEKIVGQNGITEVEKLLNEGLWQICYDALTLLEIDFYDGIKLFKFLEHLPKNIRDRLYFIEKNFNETTDGVIHDPTWDKYRELIDKWLTEEQIKYLFSSIEQLRTTPRKAELIETVNNLAHQLNETQKVLAKVEGERQWLINRVIPIFREKLIYYTEFIRNYKISYEQELQEIYNEINRLSDELQKTIRIAEIYYQTSEEEKRKLREQVEDEKKYGLEVLATSERWNKDKFEDLEQKRVDLIEMIREKNDELDEQDEEIYNQQTKIEDLENNLDNERNNNQTLRLIKEIKQQKEVVKQLESYIVLLNQIAESELTDLKNDKQELEQAGERLLSAYYQKEKEIEEKVNQLSHEQTTNSYLFSLISKLEKKIIQLDKKGNREHNRKRINSLNRKLENLTTENNSLKIQLTYFKDQDPKLRETIQGLQTHTCSLCSLPHLPAPHVCPIVQQVNCSHADYDQVKNEWIRYKNQLENHNCPDNSCSEDYHNKIRLEREKEIIQELNTRLNLGLGETNLNNLVIYLHELLNKPNNQEPKEPKQENIIVNNGEDLEEIKKVDLNSLEKGLGIILSTEAVQSIKDSSEYKTLTKIREDIIREQMSSKEKNNQLLVQENQRLSSWKTTLIIFGIVQFLIITSLLAKTAISNKKKRLK